MKVIHSARFIIDESIYQQEDNVFVFDKPYQCTSFDLVAKVKWAMKHKFGKKLKVGHAGTLDPLATGVMIVCTGRYTKQIDQFQAREKEYTGTFRLGETTPSFDMEKPVDETFPTEHITEEMVRKVAAGFVGEQEQVPPQFSAVRIAGRRAFSYARQGEDVEIKPRQIEIAEFEITRCELPEVDFRIVCSKGTYIRSIARDFGLALESGAHLTALRRTRVGDFKVEDAIVPQAVEDKL
ncbi:MAG: tRNA pseudouridine(55) synthase TruB [Bacteroidales bacterium]|nr:tRNA pseudouridine(55) synthase TruB [Bacteroidales bacterium]